MKNLPKPAAIAIVVVALLVVTALGYFLVISPNRSKASELKQETETVQAQIQALRISNTQVRQAEPIRVADLFRVSKAMPATDDMPGVIIELNRIARDAGIRFESITPQDASDAGGYLRRPIDLVFDGNFYELSDFLFRLRSLVRVRGGQLQANGRLFTVNSLNFAESARSFPDIKATLQVSAFVYGTGAPQPPAPPAPGAPAQPAPAQPAPAQPAPAQPAPAQPPAAAAGATTPGA
ncbi:MAG TPA: type 4a pilus biogenesis protein PilO [Gaiellaceae bacterium]|nr:type 4a pilus biogenesis protein PilO [Gaiellaceae bacterium]